MSDGRINTISGMSLGRTPREQPGKLWVATADLAKSKAHPFYRSLNRILEEGKFDQFVEDRCAQFYAAVRGRRGLAPGRYFRLLLIGYFESLASEREIAWRADDSRSLRAFLWLSDTDVAPDHSTISRTRRRIDLETHQAVLGWILQRLTKAGLLRGKTLGVDATTLEANAAMGSIVRRVSGEDYLEFLGRLAKESGIKTPTRAQLLAFDRRRKKRTSNEEWKHPHDPDAKVTRMKDGRTRMGHKVEHAVDMDTGAVLAVTVHPGSSGDTQTVGKTLEAVDRAIPSAPEKPAADEAKKARAGKRELVADKGYHSNRTVLDLERAGMRTYISEPDRGRRRWLGRPAARDAVYRNRRRIRGERGRRLMRMRGEKVERGFAHCYRAGGLRRVTLRGHNNLLKRLLIQVGGFDLALLMRGRSGIGTPRQLQGRARERFLALLAAISALWGRSGRLLGLLEAAGRRVCVAAASGGHFLLPQPQVVPSRK